jgi:hypothetical protein
VPQRVVERDDTARSQQPDRLRQVVAVLRLRRVAEDQVVAAVGQPRQHVECAAGDQPASSGGDACFRQRLTRDPLVLAFDVDRRQHALRRHPTQQVDRRDARAGADLDDRARGKGRREEAEHRTATRTDRYGAELGPAPARGEQRLVLRQPRLGELPGPVRERRFVCR